MIEHSVSYPGETLGLIAGWYTGAMNNWQRIQRYNSEIDLKKIRIGDRISIPPELVVRSDPMPRSFVRAFYRSKARQEAPPKQKEHELTGDTVLGERYVQLSEPVESDPDAAKASDDLLMKLLDDRAGSGGR